MIVLAPDFMTKIGKKAVQDFFCTVSKVFDRVKTVALWSAKNPQKVKWSVPYDSTNNINKVSLDIQLYQTRCNISDMSVSTFKTADILYSSTNIHVYFPSHQSYYAISSIFF